MLLSLIDRFKPGADRNCEAMDIVFFGGAIKVRMSDSATGEVRWERSWAATPGRYLPALEKMVGELDLMVGQSAPEIRLVAPDPEIKHFMIKVASVPDGDKEIRDLVKWWLREEYHVDTEEYLLDYFLGNDGDVGISVFLIRKEWLLPVFERLKKLNFVVSSVMAHSVYISQKNDGIPFSKFIVTICDQYISYLKTDNNVVVELLNSSYFANDNLKGKISFLQRANRELSSVMLRSDSSEDSSLAVLKSCELDIDYEDIFNNFSCAVEVIN